jgi:predicted component of type VI protein secretion system
MALDPIEVNQNIDELKKLLDRAVTQTEELNKTLDEIKAFKAFMHVHVQ